MSICLSVTLRHCIKTNKTSIMSSSTLESPNILVIGNSNGVIPSEGNLWDWGGYKLANFAIFWPISQHISETVQDRTKVAIHHYSLICSYTEICDLVWPWLATWTSEKQNNTSSGMTAGVGDIVTAGLAHAAANITNETRNRPTSDCDQSNYSCGVWKLLGHCPPQSRLKIYHKSCHRRLAGQSIQ